ncbi:hypothetical protein [Chitinimonas koreensis]|uniref:hypothetical protein n=1 Tax=Chitinimonas koreensis TaxID=356302 RepID=UPI0004126960|nr:hypothetical protein [Chitinimonas koreensis]
MSAAQLWLFVTDGGLAAWRWQAAQLQPIAAFTSDAAGRAAFDALAARYRKARWRLLLDLQDEDCRVDTVPHLGARDRHRLMERRLEANHPGLRYRSALTLGRDAHGRRDDRVLLAALTNPSALEAWLAILQAHDARLAGIASLAALTALHAHRLAGLPPCALLVSRQQGSGLRQSYLADGVLHFTRLTRTDDDRPAVLAALLGSETLRARQYLASQRLLEREQLLDVVLLCSEAEGAALRPHCADGTQIRYHFVALRPDAAMEAMPHASEAIWLQLAARHGLVNQYASPALRQTDLAARAARGLWLGGLSFCLLGSAVGGFEWQAARQYQAQAARLSERLAEAKRRLPGPDTAAAAPDFLPQTQADAVLRYRALADNWPDLRDDLRMLSRALEQVPAAELEQLDWQVDALTDRRPEAAPAPSSRPQPAADTFDTRPARRTTIELSARRAGASSDDAIDSARRLARTLIASGLAVAAPGDRSARDRSPDGRFTLKLVRAPAIPPEDWR